MEIVDDLGFAQIEPVCASPEAPNNSLFGRQSVGLDEADESPFASTPEVDFSPEKVGVKLFDTGNDYPDNITGQKVLS